MMKKSLFLSGIVFLMLIFLSQAGAGTAYATGSHILILDNGIVEVRMNTRDYGGAITYLGVSGAGENLINNYDLGRQIQQSYYAGEDMDRRDEGQHPGWSPWPWNPTQAGDAYDNPSVVTRAETDNHSAYLETIPNLWDMNDEKCKCVMQTWVELDGNTVRVRNRFEISEDAPDWKSRPRHQEMPAIYTVSSLQRIKTYLGSNPWTGAPLTRISRQTGLDNGNFPWEYWPSDEYPGEKTEKWAAAVDNDGFGLGVFMPETDLFIGGHAGRPDNNEHSYSTTYISPLKTIALNPGDELEFEYELILGTLEEIRSHAYSRMDK